MFERIFPARIDNRFRGHPLALWIFVPIALMKIARSLLHIFAADGGAQSISTMPLDAYPAGAAQNIIGLFARMGLDQFMLGLLLLVVLLRYRAMIPLMYLLIVAQFIAEKGIVQMKPLSLAGTSGANAPALVVALLSVIGLILSLTGRRTLARQD